MTFAYIVNLVQQRLNLTSPDSAARIGQEINDRHRRITSSLGMNITRRVTMSASMTPGINTLTFTNAEKIINIVDRSVNPFRVLKEISVEELRATQPSPNTFCSYYCIVGVSWNSVTVEMDCVPAAPLTFFADVLQNAATLSGSMEPLFPESFHDVLFHGALEDEYLKLEKLKLANDSGQKYASRLSDLRFFFAKSSYIDWVQGKTRGTIYEEGVPGAGGGAGSGATVSTTAGTWSPVDGNGIVTLSVNSAQYYAIANLVFVSFDIVYPTTTSTASAVIGGLPFINKPYQTALTQGYGGLALDWAIPASSSTVIPYLFSSNIQALNENLSGLRFVISGCYTTSSH